MVAQALSEAYPGFVGVTADVVLSQMADGRIFQGSQAVEAGLVDGVSTFEALIADLAAKHIILAAGARARALPGPAAAASKSNKISAVRIEVSWRQIQRNQPLMPMSGEFTSSLESWDEGNGHLLNQDDDCVPETGNQ